MTPAQTRKVRSSPELKTSPTFAKCFVHQTRLARHLGRAETIHKAGLGQLGIFDPTDSLTWPHNLSHDPAILHDNILRRALYRYEHSALDDDRD
ncbi:MAG: hypothetical protein Q9197_006251 [Variospora fuerteventurae]